MDTVLDHLTSEAAGPAVLGPNFVKVSLFSTCVLKNIYQLRNELAYEQDVWLQNCPIGGHLNFSVTTRKNAKRMFCIKHSFLEICPKKKISRIGPCEGSRHYDSENVELIGCVTF